MTILRMLAAAVFLLFAPAAPAAEADPPAAIGRLNHIAGSVSFAPAQAPEDWTEATLNRPVTTGDRLWTDAGGRAEIHVGSLAIRMASQTSLDVLNLDDRALQLRLAQGSVNLRARRPASEEPVEIATPGGAVVLRRPGSYRVNVDPQGATTSVAVRGGGQAQVYAANGSFVVSDGQQATIAGPRQDLAIAPAPDEFDRWAATRDQREDRVASTRYVPAGMTGYEDLDEYGSWQTVPQYGAVWQPTTVPGGWAPYRYGHWVWIEPWGWTWVDDAPWGFAPSHYGRWIWLDNYWAWAPGRRAARPVYAPALVAFIGGPNFSVSIGAGSASAVGWVPLGWREPYRPWYHASQAHVRNVNIAHVTNVTNITNVTNMRYVNRGTPSAVTVVSRDDFVAARPVQPAALRVPARTIAAAPVTRGAPVAAPAKTSLAQARPGARPPAEVRTREAVAVSAPPAPARAALRDAPARGPSAGLAAEGERPRVRVIARQEGVNPPQGEPQRAAERPAQPGQRERVAEKAPAQPQGSRAEPRRAPPPPAEVTAPDARRSPQQVEQHAREQQAGREQQSQRQQEDGRREQQRQLAQQQQRRQQAEEQHARRQAETQQKQQQRAQSQQQRQQQAQERAQEQAHQQQQAQQRAQQQAQHEAQQRVQQQQHEAQQRAQQQVQQQPAQQQRREQSRRPEQPQEKGERERPRADKSDKG